MCDANEVEYSCVLVWAKKAKLFCPKRKTSPRLSKGEELACKKFESTIKFKK
jgi:hypothetical protein